MTTKQIFLGGANFGAPYGICSNMPFDEKELNQILKWSQQNIDGLDLAEDYQDANRRISKQTGKLRLATKIDLIKMETKGEIHRFVTESLFQVGRESYDVLYVRFPQVYDNFKNTKYLWQYLLEIKERGLIKHLGASIYETDEIGRAIEIFNGIEVFQVPANLANRSFPAFLEGNREKVTNYKFYVRSVFLQGLLLMQEDSVPNHLKQILEFRKSLSISAAEQGSNVLELCLSYIKQLPWVDGIVVGTTSLQELQETVSTWKSKKQISFEFLKGKNDLPKKIIDPRLWREY